MLRACTARILGIKSIRRRNTYSLLSPVADLGVRAFRTNYDGGGSHARFPTTRHAAVVTRGGRGGGGVRGERTSANLSTSRDGPILEESY